MSNIIAFVSIKGGVGKTTIALETAASLVNDFGKRVLLVDANFSAPNLGLYLNLTKELYLQDALNETGLHNVIYEYHGVDVVPASLDYSNEFDTNRLKKVLEKFKNRYDFIILDSSPNYEELKPVIEAADRIFIITSPDHITLTTSLKAAKIAKDNKTPIEGLIVNRIRSPRHEYNLEEIEEISQIPVMAKIRDHVGMAESIQKKKPMVILDPSNPVSKEIRRLSAAISGNPEETSLLGRLFSFRNNIQKERINRQFLKESFYRSS